MTLVFSPAPLGWAIAPSVGAVYGILFVASHLFLILGAGNEGECGGGAGFDDGRDLWGFDWGDTIFVGSGSAIGCSRVWYAGGGRSVGVGGVPSFFLSTKKTCERRGNGRRGNWSQRFLV